MARNVLPALRDRPIGDQLAGPQRRDHGLILLLSGVGGEAFLTHELAHGLVEAGLPDAIEIFPWAAAGVPLVGNLMTYQLNRHRATYAADRIRRYQQQYPGRPVHLIGYSGGGGEAVLILEQLDPAHRVTSAILLAAAVSPDYNLAPALRHTTYGIYNFRNPRDRMILGLAMVVLGTIDRRHTVSAGMVGFRLREGIDPADADVYRTLLHQPTWDRRMLQDGHPGGHVGWTRRMFVRRWIAPIIQAHKLGKVAEF